MNLQEHSRSPGKAERVRVMTVVCRRITRKVITFKGKKRVTPSVIAPGDTKLSDAAAHIILLIIIISIRECGVLMFSITFVCVSVCLSVML